MLPGLLGLVGAAGTGVALAPALQALTWPFFVLSILTLSRGWYLTLQRGHAHATNWQRRSRLLLVGSTVLTISLWGLRFAGLLGARPM